MILAVASFIVCLFGAANAHFTLDYPPTRGLEHDTMNKSVCGGFDRPGNRTLFPLTGGKIQVSPGHPAAMYAEIAFLSNPTNLSQFNTTSGGANYKKLVDLNAVNTETVCWNADIASLNVPAARNGTNATLLIIYETETSTLYQCADLILSSTATIPTDAIFSNVTCKNIEPGSFTGIPEGHGHGATSTAPSSSPTGTSGAVVVRIDQMAAASAFAALLFALM